MNEQNMQYIDIKKLKPHKDNPRKDLGDLTELSESIKAKGILQNLTVVPYLGEISGQPTGFYTVIIGHRRLAAAELAGLEQVPCVVSEMNGIDQIATMLLENMQRNDLTLTEQANGFQLMIDLGDNISSIAGKTGLSETTIRRRVKLTELDQAKLMKAMDRGATLMDFAELEKIKDAKLRNKVLDAIGTNNFKWELQKAIDDSEKPERKAQLIAELEQFAVQIEDKTGLALRWVSQFYDFKTSSWWKTPEDAGAAKYYFLVDDSAITLYGEPAVTTATEIEPDEQLIAYNDRKAKLDELSEHAYHMRYEFVKRYLAAKSQSKEICRFAMIAILDDGFRDLDNAIEMLNISIPADIDNYDDEQAIPDLILERYSEEPEYTMLVTAYSQLGDSASCNYYRAQGWNREIAYDGNPELNRLYDGLISLGYIMSDDEIALRDGTHELFNNPEEVEADA